MVLKPLKTHDKSEKDISQHLMIDPMSILLVKWNSEEKSRGLEVIKHNLQFLIYPVAIHGKS